MDLFYETNWHCPEDRIKYNNMLEKEQVFDFLQGLNSDLDEVCGWLVGTKSLPSTQEAFAEVRHEESRKCVMMITSSSSQPDSQPLGSGLAANSGTLNDSRKPRSQWCNHYKKPYHTNETCWKLHGKPANWKPWKQREANLSAIK